MVQDQSPDREHKVVALNLWGNALYDQKKYNEAVAKYQKAIKLDPKYVFPYVGWGNALYLQTKYDEAIAEYQTAIELDRKNVEASNSWGVVLGEQQKYKEAEEKLAKARELSQQKLVDYGSRRNYVCKVWRKRVRVELTRASKANSRRF